MANINIVSNISSKDHAGKAYCIIDGKKKVQIIEDCIYLNIEGKHKIEIGYEYAPGIKGGILHNYEDVISGTENEQWYWYKVPILLDGKGRMKEISKIRFEITRYTRKLANNWLFLILIIFLLLLLASFR